MSLSAQRAAALKAAQEAMVAMEADPSEANIKAASDAADVVKGLDARIEESEVAAKTIRELNQMSVPQQQDGVQRRAGSLGEHVVAALGEKLAAARNGRFALAAPEYKDDEGGGGGPGAGSGGSGDSGTVGPVLTEGTGAAAPMASVLTEVDRRIIQAFRRPTITSLFGQGRISGQAITYFVEGGRTGEFETVAEAGKLPQLGYALPEPVTDTVSKIGGYIKLSDEMLQDLDYVVTEINGRLIYNLALVEENQVLYGDGTGTDLTGLLERDGIGSEDATRAELPDVIFGEMAKISQDTGLAPDAIVINPADYQELRLMKDDNEQYYGGGFFAGQYGVGGIMEQPPIWGLRTVVSPAVAAGTAVVGAFKAAASIYTRSGLYVEATNSNEEDFIHGLVTVRATKRIALAVFKPAAFSEITITSGVTP